MHSVFRTGVFHELFPSRPTGKATCPFFRASAGPVGVTRSSRRVLQPTASQPRLCCLPETRETESATIYREWVTPHRQESRDHSSLGFRISWCPSWLSPQGRANLGVTSLGGRGLQGWAPSVGSPAFYPESPGKERAKLGCPGPSKSPPPGSPPWCPKPLTQPRPLQVSTGKRSRPGTKCTVAQHQ